jgi:hypothetical protein
MHDAFKKPNFSLSHLFLSSLGLFKYWKGNKRIRAMV